MSADWGYCEHNGPQIWPQSFEVARNGKRQSPIDICTNGCVSCECSGDQLSPLRVQYPPLFSGLSVQNTGHGWKVDIPENLALQTTLSGGPLQHNYRLAQFHCHWGKDCNVGSEHTVDGKSYAAELHFVHWNAELFTSAAEAMSSDNGLAVLGVFLEPSAAPNEELNKLLAPINDITFKGDVINIAQDINIDRLLPENRTYFTYLGSLTTPPLYESVTWIVFKQPIQCTDEQIAAFRNICFCNKSENTTIDDNHLVENYRLPQPLNGRIVTLVNN